MTDSVYIYIYIDVEPLVSFHFPMFLKIVEKRKVQSSVPIKRAGPEGHIIPRSKVGGKFSMNMAMRRVDNVSEFIKMLTLCKECFSLCSDESFSVCFCVCVCRNLHVFARNMGTAVVITLLNDHTLPNNWFFGSSLLFVGEMGKKKAMAKLEAAFFWLACLL